ncbi:GNAT family N-acetyltransferase [Agromyces seonyuensis]|uniref:GNAT family N-acetyltransferase n=1 Tax=Agromyces seonyuensis TaxID=2662446 RepID=A0A6I4P183_9MICO|nr:GNAT family N-acetyltransferase [Agromyces seonyuensis]MWC00299.1 GNAT family N-acetyltransferase [Agromyces seonyuensis]
MSSPTCARGACAGSTSDPTSSTLPHRSKGTRRRLRQCAGALADELGRPLRFEARATDEVDGFLRMEDAGWKGDAGHGGEGFLATGMAEWFAEVTAGFRDRGRLRVNALAAGDRTVYVAFNFRSADAEFGFVDTYDTGLAEHRPGVLGRTIEMRRLDALSDVAYLDPCLDPTFAEAMRLYPHRRTQANLIVAHGGAASQALAAALPTARDVRDRMRRVLAPSR